MVQRAFGASKAEIMFKHVCKNVLLPIITKLGMALPTLVTGAVITETVFSWPGIGPYFIKAVQGMDYPIIMIVLVLFLHPGHHRQSDFRYIILCDRPKNKKDEVR